MRTNKKIVNLIVLIRGALYYIYILVASARGAG